MLWRGVVDDGPGAGVLYRACVTGQPPILWSASCATGIDCRHDVNIMRSYDNERVTTAGPYGRSPWNKTVNATPITIMLVAAVSSDIADSNLRGCASWCWAFCGTHTRRLWYRITRTGQRQRATSARRLLPFPTPLRTRLVPFLPAKQDVACIF